MATTTIGAATIITSQEIVERRRALGISQAKLARLLDMNANSMCQIERGALRPSPRRAQQIAQALEAYEQAMAKVKAVARA